MVDIHGAKPSVNLLKIFLKAYRLVVSKTTDLRLHLNSRLKMSLEREEYGSMYQRYFGEFRKTDILYCLLGSRDPRKTHGQATETYLKEVLPRVGVIPTLHFDIDPYDGNCEYKIRKFDTNNFKNQVIILIQPISH